MTYCGFEEYLADAFAVPENRARADFVFHSILEQIGKFWGTLLGVRGYSRGESFVARNVGLKSYWQRGEWRVKIIFMDHDALVVPGPQDQDFSRGFASLPTLDTTYLWADRVRCSSIGTCVVFYRPSDEVFQQGLVLSQRRESLQEKSAGVKRPKTTRAIEPTFVERLPDWDPLVKGFLTQTETTALST